MSEPRHGTIAAPGGIRLAYLEAGRPEGRPILLLHGLGHAARVWARQLEHPTLAHLRLVALDLRGHGDSGWRPEDVFDGATWAADLPAVVDGLGLDDVTIVAWSYAGLVLADSIAAHGTRGIRAVNLVAAAVRAGFPEAYADFGAGALPDGLLSDDPAVARSADAVFVAESAGLVPFSPAEAAELGEIVGRTPREVLRRLLARQCDHAALWASVRVPVLLTHGTRDRINLPIISDRQAARIDGARLSTYEGAGHLPFRDAPDRFAAELRALAEA